MLEDLERLQEKAGVLVNWVAEMKDLIRNPYASGLNVPKVLEDLGGYAADMVREINSIQEKAQSAEESEKAESASVEQ